MSCNYNITFSFQRSPHSFLLIAVCIYILASSILLLCTTPLGASFLFQFQHALLSVFVMVRLLQAIGYSQQRLLCNGIFLKASLLCYSVIFVSLHQYSVQYLQQKKKLKNERSVRSAMGQIYSNDWDNCFLSCYQYFSSAMLGHTVQIQKKTSTKNCRFVLQSPEQTQPLE